MAKNCAASVDHFVDTSLSEILDDAVCADHGGAVGRNDNSKTGGEAAKNKVKDKHCESRRTTSKGQLNMPDGRLVPIEVLDSGVLGYLDTLDDAQCQIEALAFMFTEILNGHFGEKVVSGIISILDSISGDIEEASSGIREHTKARSIGG